MSIGRARPPDCGKNATDAAMVIDAMDLLYSGRLDGFCIASSDSDFTRLAARLRESGMTVLEPADRRAVTGGRDQRGTVTASRSPQGAGSRIRSSSQAQAAMIKPQSR